MRQSKLTVNCRKWNFGYWFTDFLTSLVELIEKTTYHNNLYDLIQFNPGLVATQLKTTQPRLFQLKLVFLHLPHVTPRFVLTYVSFTPKLKQKGWMLPYQKYKPKCDCDCNSLTCMHKTLWKTTAPMGKHTQIKCRENWFFFFFYFLVSDKLTHALA